ncbi:MAG: PDZ domain-containing protein [Campylobacterales bacterium]
MNRYITKKNLILLNRLLLVFLIIQAGALTMVAMLKKSGIERFSSEENTFFELYSLNKLLDIAFLPPPPPAPKVVSKTITEEVMRQDSYKVVALFSGGQKSFIMLEDGAKTELIDKGGSYKHYKLVDIIGNRAIFEAYGKRYELIAGVAGTLPRKEIITRTVNEIETQATPSGPMRTVQTYLSVPRSEVIQYSHNLAKIWENISIEEVRSDEMIQGFKVKSIREGSIFAKLDLQPGDMIVSVNNKRLRSYSDAFYFYKNILKFNSLKITVVRNNAMKDLEYEIRN